MLNKQASCFDHSSTFTLPAVVIVNPSFPPPLPSAPLTVQDTLNAIPVILTSPRYYDCHPHYLYANQALRLILRHYLNPFPAFRMPYEVCCKVHMQCAACRCWMLTSCINSNFWYILRRSWVVRMNISVLFHISLRLLLDENSISGVNGLAGKGLTQSRRYDCQPRYLCKILALWLSSSLPLNNSDAMVIILAASAQSRRYDCHSHYLYTIQALWLSSSLPLHNPGAMIAILATFTQSRRYDCHHRYLWTIRTLWLSSSLLLQNTGAMIVILTTFAQSRRYDCHPRYLYTIQALSLPSSLPLHNPGTVTVKLAAFQQTKHQDCHLRYFYPTQAE